MTFLQSVLADGPFSISTIRNDKTGEILQDGFKRSVYCPAKEFRAQGSSGLVRRRSTSKINWAEWIFTAKENDRETEY
jgi:hypothetical protein